MILFKARFCTEDSKSCWLFGDQATLKAHGNATSGPKICDPVDTKMSVTTGSEEDEKKVVAKLGKLAQVAWNMD